MKEERINPGLLRIMFEGQCASEVLQLVAAMKEQNGDPCGSKDARVPNVLETTKVPKNGYEGIRASSP